LIVGEEMGYIPGHAKWYTAELVEEITVEGDPRNVVHKNLMLIRADSPEDAYQKAVALGKESEVSYANPHGKLVRIRFRGLAELNVIYDELDHGAELLYEERTGVSKDEIESWIIPKEHLSVFRPRETSKSPDYSSGEIVDEAKALFKDSTK
jgi:uncharacterized protein DUF4288